MSVRIAILGSAHPNAAVYAAHLRTLPGIEFAGIAEEANHLPSERLDGVIVCAETYRRLELVERAAAARIPVLCENPLAAHLVDAEAMVAVCERADVPFYVALPYRFHPAYDRLRQAVQTGELGTLLGARASHLGIRPEGWLADKRFAGGGALLDRSIAVIDLLRDLTQSEPVAIHAEITNGIGHGDCDDIALLTLTFASGFFASVDSSWSLPRAAESADALSLTLTGTGGTADLDIRAQHHTVLSDRLGRPSLSNWGDDLQRHLVAAFAAVCASEAPPRALVTGAEGLKAARVAFVAYRLAAEYSDSSIRFPSGSRR